MVIYEMYLNVWIYHVGLPCTHYPYSNVEDTTEELRAH
jgi:hypothetical protein